MWSAACAAADAIVVVSSAYSMPTRDSRPRTYRVTFIVYTCIHRVCRAHACEHRCPSPSAVGIIRNNKTARNVNQNTGETMYYIY
jgi:hypothetical protein